MGSESGANSGSALLAPARGEWGEIPLHPPAKGELGWYPLLPPLPGRGVRGVLAQALACPIGSGGKRGAIHQLQLPAHRHPRGRCGSPRPRRPAPCRRYQAVASPSMVGLVADQLL